MVYLKALQIIMARGRFIRLGFCSLLLSGLCCGWGQLAQGQVLSTQVDKDRLVRLHRAICLQQWDEAIGLTSEVIASADISRAYRQEMLNFRRELEAWRMNPVSPTTESSCDRSLPLFITLAEPESPEPQPLDWNRALEALRASRPIIDLDDDYEPTVTIPAELLATSPEVLTNRLIAIDTADGFDVVGGQVNSQAEVYGFLARLGDRVSLEVNVTRSRGGDPQVFLFDHQGQLLSQSQPGSLSASVQNVAIPKTDVYFAVVSPQGTAPVLNARGVIVGWRAADTSSFAYTLTLTGVTPYQTLLY